MINQGMILGRSSFVYRINDTNKFVTFEKRKEYKTSRIHVDISLVDNDILDVEGFKKWRSEFNNAEFLLNEDNKMDISDIKHDVRISNSLTSIYNFIGEKLDYF